MPSGESVMLRALTAGKPSVLIFYRGGWCPYCNRQLSGLVEIEADLQALGYQIIAFSPDQPSIVAEAAQLSEQSYQLVSDSPLNAAQAFGVAFTVDDATLQRREGYSAKLEKASGQNHHMLPVPAIFLTNSEGRITYRYFNPDFRVRLSAEDLLAAAKDAVVN